MREIKFRAWDAEANPPWMLDSDICGEWNVEALMGSGMEVMQYTGLKDKNGKEIYEGDVVATKGLYVPHFIVEWLNSGYALFDNDDGFLSPDEFEWDWFEIIGNMYESPELLDESK